MSFFAGSFERRIGARELIRDPAVRRACRIDQSARIWHDAGQGLLAHAQSVVTPEDLCERLPLVFCGGRKVLVFDGRLDNRDELVRGLGLQRAEARGDSAILAAAIERWGDEVCSRLLGDFAFACWDARAERLLLACDHTCGRILYYHVNPAGIRFATTMDALCGFPGVSRDVDLSTVAQFLLDRPSTPGQTMFREIRQLPGGARAVWSATDGVRVSRYWTPDFGRRIRYSHDEDYTEHARELLDHAVRCRLRAIGPVVCQLSGGFDSAGVAATAARLTAPQPLHSVTAVPQRDVTLRPESRNIFVDEWKHAAAVADMHPNLMAHAVPADAPTKEDPRVLFFVRGGLVRNDLNLSWFGASNRKVRELGVKVMLCGTAGNLTLSWRGNQHLSDLARAGRLFALTREVTGLARNSAMNPWRIFRREVLPAILPARLRCMRRKLTGAGQSDWLSRSAISSQLASAAGMEKEPGGKYGKVDGLDLQSSVRLQMLERIANRGTDAALRPYLGFERRDPLRDVRLIDFCIAIPPEQYMLDGVTRRLARRVLADRLPAKVLRETRIGNQCPEWFHRLSHQREQMAASLERLRRSPLASYALDLPRMKAILDRWPADAAAAEQQYIPLMMVLSKGVNVGEFLEWTEEGCPAPPGARDRHLPTAHELNDLEPVPSLHGS